MLRRCTVTATLLAALLAPFSPAQAQLPQPVASLMQQHALTLDEIGVVVLRDGTPLLAHGTDKPMQPASTMKLVPTLVGLERLGPTFRGRTELRTDGEIKYGGLHGNLYLKGLANADLSGDVLRDLLRALRYQGIERIEGQLVLDRTLFQPARFDQGLPPFDESPEAYYNVIPDALLVNKNMVQLDLRANGRSLTVHMLPELANVKIRSHVTLVDAECSKWENGWQVPQAQKQDDGRLLLVLSGTFPKNCARTTSVNVIDRDDYVERLVRQTWKSLGGSFEGETVVGATPAGTQLLAAQASRPLSDLLRDINKPSDNALARTLYLSLGSLGPDSTQGSAPLEASQLSTFIRAEAAVRDYMRSQGIDDTGLVMDNGSGLSRSERITPLQLAGLLAAGLRSRWAPEFISSLPIAGIDGTLRRRLDNGPAAGLARMKTGTLRNVVALAGYVPDASGKLCIVVAMVNSERAGEGRGRAVLDALVEWVARSGSLPAPATIQ